MNANTETSILDFIMNATPTVEQPPVIQKQEDEAPAKPPMFAVMLHNDPSTDFYFVARVLREVFGDAVGDKARNIAMAAHTNGKAVVGIYSEDVANTKVERAMSLARTEGRNNLNPQQPCELTFTSEPETDGE